jgi:hypothetical protein
MNFYEITVTIFIVGTCFVYRTLWKEATRRWACTEFERDRYKAVIEQCIECMDEEPAKEWLKEALKG